MANPVNASRSGSGLVQRDLLGVGTPAQTGYPRADDMPVRVQDDTPNRRVYPGEAVVEPSQAVGPSHHAPVAPSGRAKAHGSSGSGLLRSESK